MAAVQSVPALQRVITSSVAPSCTGAFFQLTVMVPLWYVIIAAWLYHPSADEFGMYTAMSAIPSSFLYLCRPPLI